MNHLFKKFRGDILGLVWLALGVFVALALMSYHPMDPSFNSTGSVHKVANYCGYFGSFMADIFYQCLGASAWLIVISFFRISWICFLNRESNFNGSRWVWSILLFATSCSLIGLYFPNTRMFAQQIPAAGLVGMMVSKGLVRIFNFAGVAVILWTATAVLLIFYSEQTLKDLLFLPSAFLKLIATKSRKKLKGLLSLKFLPSFRDSHTGESVSSNIFLKGEKENTERGARSLFAIKNEGGKSAAPLPQKSPAKLFATEASPRVDNSLFSAKLGENQSEEPALSGFLVNRTTNVAKRHNVGVSKRTIERVENWSLPKLSILADPPPGRNLLDEKEVKIKAKILIDKLGQFSIRGNVVGIKPGPAITMFEFKPAADVKISKITDLADDLSLALSSESVRIIAPIPGRDVVGIETSNPHRETVFLKDILMQEEFWDEEMKLPIALGRQADGEPKVVDLRKMPHMLVAGSTGSGKSVFVVGFLAGLLFRHSPKTLRLILVDPKQVDLASFSHCPHLIMPPIREPQKAVGALKWAIREMEKRYRSMSKFGARGLEAFNEIVSKLSGPELAQHEKFHSELSGAARLDDYYYEVQPYLVIVVEEFGDLMAVDKSNVENSVVRLAQMARACGIHLILAMQSPRRDVVTGLIKTNIPGRVSFKVASKMDSRIILDESGAERLLTRGDMLYLAPGVAKPERHHGAYVSEAELSQLTEHWATQSEPVFDPLAMKILEGNGGGYDLSDELQGNQSADSDFDDRYDEILAYVAGLKEISASLIQRRFRIGYPRAARLIEMFEAEGVIGPSSGSKPRQVLVGPIA